MRGFIRLQILSLAVISSFFICQPSAKAAKVVDFYDFLSSVALGVPANHTITFVSPSGVDAATDDISITYGTSTDGYHFNLSDITPSDVALAVDNDANCDGPFAYKAVAAAAAANVWGAAVDAAKYQLTFYPPTNALMGEIPAGRCIQLMVGNNVVGGANRILNPNINDGIKIDIGGSFGDFGTIAVLIFNDSQVSVTAEVNDSSFASSSSTTPPTVSAGGWSVSFTDTVPPEVSNFKIDKIGTSSVTISWKTNEPVNCSLRYGKSYYYEIGNLIQSSYATSCVFSLSGLKPATNYLFRAVSSDKSGNQTVTDSNFSTKIEAANPDMPEFYEVENISKFEIVPSERNLLLTWERPGVEASRNILILRSDKFFPSGRESGDIVYSGLEPIARGGKVSYLDQKNLLPNRYYYYNIISLDQAGHESSGSLNFASLKEAVSKNGIGKPGEHEGGEAVLPEKPKIPQPDSSPTVSTSTQPIAPSAKTLSFTDFQFTKNLSDRIDPAGGRIEIIQSDSLLITIKKNLLSSTTNKLIANLIGKQGGAMINFHDQDADDAFYANFSNLASGEYQLIIGAYDNDNNLTEIVRGFVDVRMAESSLTPETPMRQYLGSSQRIRKYQSLVYAILLAFLALLLIVVKRRRNKNNKS